MLRLLEQKSFDQITIRDIVAEAQLGYATFFRHHSTKEALLHEVAAEQVGRLAELMLPALEASDTPTACMALCTYVDEHRKLWSTLLTGGAAAILREELLKSAAGIATGRSDLEGWLPTDLAVAFNVSGTIELLTWWLRQERPFPVKRVAQIQERIVINPVVAAGKNWTPRSVAKRKRAR